MTVLHPPTLVHFLIAKASRSSTRVDMTETGGGGGKDRVLPSSVEILHYWYCDH